MDILQSRSGVRWCIVEGCNTNSVMKTYSMFNLPENQERCKVWLQNCGQMDLLERSLKHIPKHKKICGKHFEAKMFLNDLRNRLQPFAIPTIFLDKYDTSASTSVPYEININMDIIKPTLNGGDQHWDHPYNLPFTLQEQVYGDLSCVTLSVNDERAKPKQHITVRTPTSSVACQTNIKLSCSSKRKIKLQNQLNYLKKPRYIFQKEEMAELETLKLLSAKYLSEDFADIIKTQVSLLEKSMKGS